MTVLNFPAGTYYIGDPCYAFQGSDWDKILAESDFFSNEGKTQNMWAGSTAYGDGTYNDQFGNEYPVDAGLIGIMPIEMCNFGDIRWENDQWIDERRICRANGEKFEFKPGNVVTFDQDFSVSYDYENGDFEFGHISIKTSYEYNEEWGDDEDYWFPNED